MPLISVIVPVYNVERYLPACVESILGQTYANMEVLLIDDGSTDMSGEICDRYALRDRHCKVVHQKNQGVSAARNAGLAMANGEYIGFVDGDDYIHPQMYECLYDAVGQKGDVLAMVRMEMIYDAVPYRENTPAANSRTIVLSQEDFLKGIFGHLENIPEAGFRSASNKLYPRRMIESMEFTGSDMGEDMRYNIDALPRIANVIYLDTAMYYYVQRKTSMMHQHTPKRYIDHMDSLIGCLEKLPPPQKAEMRGYYLEELYKVMMIARYNVPRDRSKEIVGKVECLVSQTFRDLVRIKNTSPISKIKLLLFVRIPVSYRLFVWLCDRIAALRKAVRK